MADIKLYNIKNGKAVNIYNTDFERYWLFVYEVLTSNELKGDYKKMKLKKVSFIKNEFF